jgi:hypothetical protein
MKNVSAEVPDANTHHFKLEEESNNCSNNALAYGYNSTSDANIQKIFLKYKRKIYFNNYSPTEFAQACDHNGKTPIVYEDFFDEVYSICPYTNKWLNSLGFDRKYRDIFYPFNEKLIPKPTIKEYDVIYHGGIHGQEHLDCLEIMSRFNYRYCSMTHSINPLTQRCLRYATNTDLPFQEKINLVAKTKISICYNFAHIRPEHIPNIKSWPKWDENEAFTEVDKWNIMPQFKTRMHEAAISKTLNLVLYDKWNIAEKYYKPNEEFIYFYNKNDLIDKIEDIVKNWDNYVPIVEKAYERSLNYTTKKFIKTIEENSEWKGIKNA